MSERQCHNEPAKQLVPAEGNRRQQCLDNDGDTASTRNTSVINEIRVSDLNLCIDHSNLLQPSSAKYAAIQQCSKPSKAHSPAPDAGDNKQANTGQIAAQLAIELLGPDAAALLREVAEHLDKVKHVEAWRDTLPPSTASTDSHLHKLEAHMYTIIDSEPEKYVSQSLCAQLPMKHTRLISVSICVLDYYWCW